MNFQGLTPYRFGYVQLPLRHLMGGILEEEPAPEEVREAKR